MGQILNTRLLVFMQTTLKLLAQGRKLRVLFVAGHEPLLCAGKVSLDLVFGRTGDPIVSYAEKLGPHRERSPLGKGRILSNLWGVNPFCRAGGPLGSGAAAAAA